MKNIPAPILSELFGVNQNTLRGWKHRGLIEPIKHTPPHPDEYTPETALRISLMMAIRRRGLPISTCTSLHNALAGYSIDALRASVARGERWLVCIGPAVSPGLLRARAIDRRIESACDAAGLAFAVVDVGAAMEQLEKYLDRDGLEAFQLDANPVETGANPLKHEENAVPV
jgi:hypothetical protein